MSENKPLDCTPLAIRRRETLFEKLADEVEKLIEADRWRVGEFLPNEVQLSEQFRVSQGTVRRALGILVDKGLLIRQPGRGTFVADYRYLSQKVAGRYVKLVPDNNEPQLPATTKVETFEIRPASDFGAEPARRLQLAPDAPLIHIERTHFILIDDSERVVSFDEHFLPAAVFTRLNKSNMAKHKDRVLYAFYQNDCGVTIATYEEQVKAELLDDRFCQKYGIPSPEPILIGRRVAYTLRKQPVEYRIQRYLTEHYHFLVHS